VHCHLIYGILIWSCTSLSNLKNLEKNKKMLFELSHIHFTMPTLNHYLKNSISGSKARRKMGSGSEKNSFGSTTLSCAMRHMADLNFAIAYWGHISGRQIPGLTRGSPPHLLCKKGVNPGFGVLRFGLWFLRQFEPKYKSI
jgi:hypothetical protein